MAPTRLVLSGPTIEAAQRRQLVRHLLTPLLADPYLAKIVFQALAVGAGQYEAKVRDGATAFADTAADMYEVAYVLADLRRENGQQPVAEWETAR